MSRETGLWGWLGRARMTLRDALHIQRVENSAGSGAGDVEGQLRDVGQFWIELKSEDGPKDPDGVVRFRVRDSQVEWHRRRQRAGGRTWFLCQVGSGARARRYLIPGSRAGDLQMGVTEFWLEGHSAMTSLRPTAPAVLQRAAWPEGVRMPAGSR